MMSSSYGLPMRCRVCDDPAAYAAAHGPVRVGLCAAHIRAFMVSLEEAESLRELDPSAGTAES